MPACGVGLSQMEMHEGYQRIAHRAVFVRFPLRGRRGENLLVWTTTPWTLSSNVAAAVNPALTYLKVRHKDQLYYVAKGAFTAKRLEDEFKRKEWVEGVPKLKSLEQMFKEKGGFEIEGELPGAGSSAGNMTVHLTTCWRKRMPVAIRPRWPASPSSKVGRVRHGADGPQGHRLGVRG